jgi:hypothetical protein
MRRKKKKKKKKKKREVGSSENAVFWDIKTQFVPHRKHNTSLLQCQPVKAT